MDSNNLNTQKETLKNFDKTILQLGRINSLLGWDMEVNLASGGTEERAEQNALIESMMHEKKTSKELEKAVLDLEQNSDKLTKDEKKLVKDYKKAIIRAKKIPSELVEERARTTAMAYTAWLSARKNNSYKEFLPMLEKILAIVLKESELIGFDDNPYDVHLDNFEDGMTTKDVDKLFIPLEKNISEIVAVLSARHKNVDDSFLTQNKEENYFAKDKQKELSMYILNELGYDFNRGNLSEVFHPFCSSPGFNDVRVTTKYALDFFNPSFWGTIHECGHALYEQGLPQQYQYSSLGNSISLGIHESQSRFFENVVGKSDVFLKRVFPKIQSVFPKQFANVSDVQFAAAINKITPSYIRIEADEVTYSLHIVLRYKIEKMLLNKQLKLSEAEEMWNSEFKRLFGIQVDKSSNGILQDVHWSHGILGYFPTYALGNLYYGQWLHEMSKTLNIMDLVAKGDYKTILAWLRTNIHQKGSTVSAKELVKEVTGEELNPNYFVDYLKVKFNV